MLYYYIYHSKEWYTCCTLVTSMLTGVYIYTCCFITHISQSFIYTFIQSSWRRWTFVYLKRYQVNKYLLDMSILYLLQDKHIYIYIHKYTYMFMYIYIFIHIYLPHMYHMSRSLYLYMTYIYICIYVTWRPISVSIHNIIIIIVTVISILMNDIYMYISHYWHLHIVYYILLLSHLSLL